MPYYKTPDNALHFLDAEDFENLLPAGAVKITDAEAEALIPPIVSLPINMVSMRQARLALLQKGLLSQVQAAISSLESPMKEVAQIEWEYATDVDRNSQLVKMLALALGLSETELDEIFNLAATL